MNNYNKNKVITIIIWIIFILLLIRMCPRLDYTTYFINYDKKEIKHDR